MDLSIQELKFLHDLVKASLDGEGANKNRIRKNTIMRKLRKAISESSKDE